MKTNKLEAAAKRIHSHARKFTRRQIAAVTAVTMGLASVTVATFSQEVKNEEIPPLPKTPTGNVELYSKEGVRLVVVLNSRTRDTISFQKVNLTSQKVEPTGFTINIDTLDQLSQDVLNGKVTNHDAVRQRQLIAGAEYREKLRASDERRKAQRDEHRMMNEEASRRRGELNKKFFHLSAKDQQKALIENERDMQVYLYSLKSDSPNFNNTDRKNVKHTPSWEFAASLKLTDRAPKDETVSLRPEFERLGVVATKQIGNSCSIYASFHLAQFLTRKHGVRPPSIEEWKRKAIVATRHNLDETKAKMFNHEVINGISEITGAGKKIHVTWVRIPLNNLGQEATKELLRKGVPVLAEWTTTKADGYDRDGGAHSSLIVGFRVKDGITQWEIIDSNHVERNGGYKFIRADVTQPEFGIEVK